MDAGVQTGSGEGAAADARAADDAGAAADDARAVADDTVGAAAVVGAAAALGTASVAGLGPNAALTAVLAARHAQAAALAVECDALARLAAVYPATVTAERSGPDAPVVLELMAALGVSQRSAANRLALAHQLTAHPDLGAALRDGSLDCPAALMVLDKIGVLDEAAGREAVARLLAAHATTPDGLTRAQLARLLGRIVARLDPRSGEERQADTCADRRVDHQPPAATGEAATLRMTGPAERVALCAQTVDTLARAILAHARRRRRASGGLTGEGSPTDAGPDVWDAPTCTTLDQARFDALDWLVTGAPASAHPAWPRPTSSGPGDCHDEGGRVADTTAPSAPGSAPATDERPGAPADSVGPSDVTDAPDGTPQPTGDPGVFAAAGKDCGCGRPRVSVTAQIVLQLSTVLGLDDTPGELAGHGAVPASVARELAASATVWQRLLTDPADGYLVTQTIRSYRPTAAIAAYVRTRHGGLCAARGCTARTGLQIDHDTPWPHGPTSTTNTVPLHLSHHQPKTDKDWHHHLDPDTGALTQTSPLRRTYTSRALPPLGGALTGETPPGDPAHRRRHLAAARSRRRRGLWEIARVDRDRRTSERHLTRLLLTTRGTGTAVGPPPAPQPGDDHPVPATVDVRPWRHARHLG